MSSYQNRYSARIIPIWIVSDRKLERCFYQQSRHELESPADDHVSPHKCLSALLINFLPYCDREMSHQRLSVSTCVDYSLPVVCQMALQMLRRTTHSVPPGSPRPASTAPRLQLSTSMWCKGTIGLPCISWWTARQYPCSAAPQKQYAISWPSWVATR